MKSCVKANNGFEIWSVANTASVSFDLQFGTAQVRTFLREYVDFCRVLFFLILKIFVKFQRLRSKIYFYFPFGGGYNDEI